jgi:hypothetical protein
VPGRFGVRIQDVVVADHQGGHGFNNTGQRLPIVA